MYKAICQSLGVATKETRDAYSVTNRLGRWGKNNTFLIHIFTNLICGNS